MIAVIFLFGCTGPADGTQHSSTDTSSAATASTSASPQDSSETTAIRVDNTSATGGVTDAQNSAGTFSGTASDKSEAATKHSSATQPQTTAADNTVLLYINCINAVNYGIRNQPGYDKIVPADGVILDTSAELQKSDTVLSLLKRVLQEKGILLNNQRSYIKGIGGLNDFDCGPSSGWLYSVNGVFPSYSSSQYILKSGDKIKILYSVNSGDVTDLSAWN